MLADEGVSKRVFLAKHPSFTLSQLNNWLRHRETNGLACCVVKIGRGIYIKENCFWAWFNGHDDKGKWKEEAKQC